MQDFIQILHVNTEMLYSTTLQAFPGLTINAHKMKYLLLLLLLLTGLVDGYAQETNNTVRALKKKMTGKTLKQQRRYGTSEATYLGTLSDQGGGVTYYVVKEFWTVQAANVAHGHSRILFYNRHAKVVAEAVLDMPDELPQKISANALIFTYRKNKTLRTFAFRMKNKPEMLCVEPEACYTIDYK